MKKVPSIKIQLIIFLVLFGLYLAVREGVVAFTAALAAVTAAAVIIEAVFIYAAKKKICVTTSACITGLILGIVLAHDGPWWHSLVAAGAAIVGKNLIRIKGRHFFNPAAFGIVIAMIICGARTAWYGTYAWYILIPVGLYFIIRLRKEALLVSYAVTAFLLFAGNNLIMKIPFTDIMWYFSYFFIFIMLIEPKTTPHTRRGGIVFGVSIAVLIFAMTQIGIRCDVELCSLIICNMVYRATTVIPNKRRSV
ncbi:MAG: RnfABCDGE type electron transport complex subunit D [Candidatus Omnitrophica bacterium]|nr:RnfABCDGE type electron transport complex subunit D [Candidatus Omnitrophota bacterium]